MDNLNVFVLSQPLDFVYTKLTKGAWYCTYLDNVQAYISWSLFDDQTNNALMAGSWKLDDETFKNWGADNTVVTNALLLAAPWNNPLPLPN